MKKLFKKIIILTYLIIFSFGLFIPSDRSFAQTTNKVILSTDKTAATPGQPVKIEPGQPITITATLNNTANLEAKIIHFFAVSSIVGTDTGYSFIPVSANCRIPASQSGQPQFCSVNFNSWNESIYRINANVYINNQPYQFVSEGVSVEIKSPYTNVIAPKAETNTTYIPLAPIPGLEKGVPFETDPSKNPCPFGKYLNIIIKLIIGFAAVLAMVMIVMGGIEYMTSDLVSSKEAGKETITHAILGLLIALGAFLILNTINPQLLSVCLDLPKATITISPEQELIIKNRSGLGNCAVVTDANNACHPDKITKDWFGRNMAYFNGDTSANEPFKKLAAQASAICQLESRGSSAIPKPENTFDKCSDNKPFSFGLFQINAAAHMNNITACNGAFQKAAGTNQGKCVDGQRDPKTGYCMQWDCKTIEPAYTTCQNYLINPANNIKEAYILYQARTPKWTDWSTYNSCKAKF